jgi:cholesterol 7-desaturase
MPSVVALPIPNSWYAVAFSDELGPGDVLARTVAQRELVIFRTRSGESCAMDAYCPHLGAHLGIGGTVEGETLRCPFHAFRFDTDGVCVATGYGTKPPPTARASVWPLREVSGVVFVYYDGEGHAPQWEPPSLEVAGWTRLRHATYDIHDHPQETVENSVDLGHFGIVHGYTDVTLKEGLAADGPHFHIAYTARRPMPFLGRLGAQVGFQYDIDIWGLGLSIVTISVERFGVTARLFVLATPTAPERVSLSLALSAQRIGDPGRIHPLARLIPRAALEELIARTIHQSAIHDARQDFVIWENKRHIHPPALAKGDGPIGAFRTWARQFYGTDGQLTPDETAEAALTRAQR